MSSTQEKCSSVFKFELLNEKGEAEVPRDSVLIYHDYHHGYDNGELEEWVQSTLPSSEEMALQLAIHKEKLADTRLANAPPLGSRSSSQRKNKKMKLKARDTNAVHYPYWNVAEYLLAARTPHWYCVPFYDEFLIAVGQRLANNIKDPFGVINPPVVHSHYLRVVDSEKNDDKLLGWREHQIASPSCCDCTQYISHHMYRIRGFHYKHKDVVGAGLMDFSSGLLLVPGIIPPVIRQVSDLRWNSRYGSALTFIGASGSVHHALFHYAFKVCRYGSFDTAFKMYQRDNIDCVRVNGSYVVKDRIARDMPTDTGWHGVAVVYALAHGGVSESALNAPKKYYNDMYKLVSPSRAMEIQTTVYRIWQKCHDGSWSTTLGPKPYSKITSILELKSAFQFLRCVFAVYRELCRFASISPLYASRVNVASLIDFASFYWDTVDQSSCYHGNNLVGCQNVCPIRGCLKVARLRTCLPFDHFAHIGKRGSGSMDCDCKTVRGLETVLYQPSWNRPASPRRLTAEFLKDPETVVNQLLPTSDTETPGPSVSRVSAKISSFFEFVKSCYQSPPLNVMPEEGAVPQGSMKPIETWLQKAIDSFFASFKTFVHESFAEFKNVLSSIWDAVLEVLKTPVKALGNILADMASPFINLLEKFLKAVGLGRFIRGRNLTVDVYCCLIGFFFFNATSSNVIKLLIVLYFINHFGLIKSTTSFISYLREQFFSSSAPPITGLDDEEGFQPTNMFVTFLTYLSSTSFVQVAIKAAVALVITISGIATTTAHKVHLTTMFVGLFKNLGYIGQGINGIHKIWTTLAEFVPKLMRWIRQTIGAQDESDKEEERFLAHVDDVRRKLFDFLTMMKVWDTDAGYATLKRSKTAQKTIVDLRPAMVYLHRVSILPKYGHIFDTNLRVELREAFKSYNKLFNIVYRVCAFGHFRPTPFHIQLVGEPGVGKSTLLSQISKQLQRKYFPDVSDNSLIFTRGNTDHFDGYANQPIMIQDDIWSTDDYKSVSEILPLISNAPLVVPMAQLVDKATFFDSKFILSTSNTMFPVTTSVRCNDAIWRRRHILAKVVIDPRVYDKQSSKFDEGLFNKYYPGVSVEERNASMPHLRFTIYSPIPSGGAPQVKSGVTISPSLYDLNNLPEGLEEPLENISFKAFINNVYNRYEAMRHEELSVTDRKGHQLERVCELYNLISDICESDGENFLGPMASSFLDMDFADTQEATEDESDSDEELVPGLFEVNTNFLVDPEEEDWDREYTPPPVPEDLPQETNEVTWESLLTPDERKEYQTYLTADAAYLRENVNQLRRFKNIHCCKMPTTVAELFDSMVERASAPDPQVEHSRRNYLLLKSKANNGEKLSRTQKRTYEHLRTVFEEGCTASSAQSEPVLVPDWMDELYVPFAGEYSVPSANDTCVIGDRVYPYPPAMGSDATHPFSMEGKRWRRGLETVAFEDGRAYLRMISSVNSEWQISLEELFKGGVPGGLTEFAEPLRTYAMFSPIKFSYKHLKIPSYFELQYPNIRASLECSKDILESLPVDFVERITKKKFNQFAALNLDNYRSGMPIYHCEQIEDFCLRECSDRREGIGAFSREQWNKISESIHEVVFNNLNYNQRADYRNSFNNCPRARLIQERPYMKCYNSPLFLSRAYFEYVRAFNALPLDVRELIVDNNARGIRQKFYDINLLKQSYRRVLRYTMAKYHGLLHKSPTPWAIGVCDALTTGFVAVYAGIIFYALRKMFMSLFGSEPEPTSRYLFKRSIPRHLKPTNLQATEDLHNQIMKNLLQIYHPLSGYANAIGIDGQCILVNTHWVRKMYEAKTDFIMQYLPTPNSNEWWEALIRVKNIRIIPDSDACIIYSRDFRCFPKIIHRFLTNDDLTKYELPEAVFQTYYDADHKIICQASNFEGIVASQNVGFLDNSLKNLVQYRAPRVAGMSGSPVYSNFPYANGRMIFGIQSCADATKSLACILTQEVIRANLPTNNIVHEGPEICNPGFTPTSDLVTEHLVKCGTVPIYNVAGIVGETEFSKTIFSPYFESNRIPAILNAFDPRVPENTHPLQHSVNKCGRNVIKSMDENILDRAVTDITTLIRSRLKGKKLQVLSMEESIIGLPQPGHEKINIKTSAGIPWIWEKQLPGKKTWIDIDLFGDLSFVHDDLVSTFNEYDAKISAGIIPKNSFYEFPKDELRPIDKVLGPPIKTRSISVMNFVFSLLYRRYCLDLEASLHGLANGTFPSCVGITPHSMAWANMYAELSQRSKVGCDFDISNWDGHFPPWLFEAVAQVFNNLYDDEHGVARRALFLNACFGYTQFLDCVLQKNRGMPSGFAGTAIVNTIGHLILFYCFYIIQCRQCSEIPSLNSYLQNISSFFYGDDVIFTVSSEFKEAGITPRGFISLYEHFGWPITSADKNAPAGVERPISDLQFLKRFFVPDPLFGKSVVYGCIQESVIFDLLHWMRKTPTPRMQLLVNINEALEYAYPRGQKYYDNLLLKINHILTTHKIVYCLPPYVEMRERMLQRYYDSS